MQNPHHDRRWLILAVLGIAQLMVVLDVTVVNVALPSAQTALHFSNDNRQWIVASHRAKNGVEHMVPLSSAAVDLINALPVIDGGEHLFTTNGRRSR